VHPDLPVALSPHRAATREVALRLGLGFSEVKRRLESYGADRELRALEDLGCNGTDIRILLEIAFLADSSWTRLVHMDLRSLKKSLAEIRRCADLIDRLNCTELVY